MRVKFSTIPKGLYAEYKDERKVVVKCLENCLDAIFENRVKENAIILDTTQAKTALVNLRATSEELTKIINKIEMEKEK